MTPVTLQKRLSPRSFFAQLSRTVGLGASMRFCQSNLGHDFPLSDRLPVVGPFPPGREIGAVCRPAAPQPHASMAAAQLCHNPFYCTPGSSPQRRGKKAFAGTHSSRADQLRFSPGPKRGTRARAHAARARAELHPVRSTAASCASGHALQGGIVLPKDLVSRLPVQRLAVSLDDLCSPLAASRNVFFERFGPIRFRLSPHPTCADGGLPARSPGQRAGGRRSTGSWATRTRGQARHAQPWPSENMLFLLNVMTFIPPQRHRPV